MPPQQGSSVSESIRTRIAATLPWTAKTWLRKGLVEVSSRPFFEHPEEAVVTDVVREVAPDDVFYDVGAFVGFYSKWVAQLVGSEVIAFEPSREEYRALRTTLGKVSGPATGLPIALGAEEGVATLSGPPPNGEGVPALSDHGSNSFEVKVLAGDQLVETYNFPEPTVMKIDVEGAELDVLTGFDGVLSSGNCDLLYVEVHRPDSELHSTIADFDATPEQLHGYLSEKGYSLTQLSEFGDHYHLKASR